MKYLAILKDSLYEALDTKVLYVTVVLSLVLLLVIASVSFKPVPAQQQLESFANLMTLLGKMQTTEEEFAVEEFRQTNDAAEPWRGDYRFDWVVRLPKEKLPGKDAMPADVRQKHYEQVTSEGATRVIIEGLEMKLDRVELGRREEVAPPAGSDFSKEYRFRVITRGTRIKDRRGWVCEPALLFGAWPLTTFTTVLRPSLGGTVEIIVDKVIGAFGAAVAILLSIIITAFFIPNMLRKGSVDLLLAKPIRRPTLLLYKFVGGLTFMFLNTAVIMVGIWLVLGLRTGLWINGLLLCVFIFTFQFAIFYAISTLTAVWTQSPIVCILLCVLSWALLWGLGWAYRGLDAVRPRQATERIRHEGPMEEGPQPSLDVPSGLLVAADVIHFVLPHYKDLDVLTTRLLRKDLMDEGSKELEEAKKSVSAINWPESIGVNVVFIVVLVGLSCWRFSARDY